MLLNVVPSTLDCHCTLGAGLPAEVAVKEAVLFRQTVASLGCAETVGTIFSVITALPDEVPVQRESATSVTVYVVVLAGLTERVAGLLAFVWENPSDQVTIQGPTPVNAAEMIVLSPGQIFVVPLTVAVGFAATVTVWLQLFVQPLEFVIVNVRVNEPAFDAVIETVCDSVPPTMLAFVPTDQW
jgi:hypothetical protein